MYCPEIEAFTVALHPPEVVVPVCDLDVEDCTCHPGFSVMVVVNYHNSGYMKSENRN